MEQANAEEEEEQKQQPEFTCDICRRQFTDIQMFSMHLDMHDDNAELEQRRRQGGERQQHARELNRDVPLNDGRALIVADGDGEGAAAYERAEAVVVQNEVIDDTTCEALRIAEQQHKCLMEARRLRE